MPFLNRKKETFFEGSLHSPIKEDALSSPVIAHFHTYIAKFD